MAFAGVDGDAPTLRARGRGAVPLLLVRRRDARPLKHIASDPEAASRKRGSSSAPAATSSSATPTRSPSGDACHCEASTAHASGVSHSAPERASGSAPRPSKTRDGRHRARPGGMVEQRALPASRRRHHGSRLRRKLATSSASTRSAVRITTSCASGSNEAGGASVGPLAAREAGDPGVGLVDIGRGAEPCEQRRQLVLSSQDGMLIRRPQGNAAAPGLAAGPVEVGAVGSQQLDRLRAATPADGVCDREALVRVGAVLEQEPDMLEPVVVERVQERVRARRRGAVLEQDPEALRALGLGRVIQRLAVVGTRTCLEQRGRELGVVLPSSSAVERRHLAVLVDEERVRVGAAREQVAGERSWCRSTNGTRRGAEPNRAGRPRRSRRRASLGRGRGAPTGSASSAGRAPRSASACARRPLGRRENERLDACFRGRDQRRPARIAVLAGEHELGPSEDRLSSAEPRERRSVARAGGADELLRLLAQLLEIELHHDLPPSEPVVRVTGRETRSRVSSCRANEVGSALPADRMRPRRLSHPSRGRVVRLLARGVAPA